MTVPHNPNELIAIVDEHDNIIGKAPRKNHANGRLHRETSLLIINSQDEILVQVRADNGKLDFSASGHFPYNETYLEGIIREVQEELGIKIPEHKFKKVLKTRVNDSTKGNNRFVTLWEVKEDYRIENMNIDTKEVRSVEYMSMPELKKIMQKTPECMTKGFLYLLKLYFREITN